MAYSKEQRIVNNTVGYTKTMKNEKKDTSPSVQEIGTGHIIPNLSGISRNWDAMNNLDDRYVNVTGDTMTGDLVIDAELKIYDSSVGDNYIRFGSDAIPNYIYFNGASGEFSWRITDAFADYTQLEMDTTNGLTLKSSSAQAFIPDATDVYDLGSSSKSWDNLYLSGDITDGTNATSAAEIKAAYDHVSDNGSDHSYIDQDVTSGSTPNFSTIKGHTNAWDFTIIDPNSVYDKDTQIFIGWAVHALTITKIVVNLDDSGNDVAGDLKYADDFISLANASTINDFDTTSGVRTDTSISSGSVASGKAIYLQFDSQPDSDINQMHVHIEWDYD